MLKLILNLIIIALLASCQTQNLFVKQVKQAVALDSNFAYEPNYEYHIRKDDKISIGVWGQEELSVGSVYGIYNSNEVYGKWLMVDGEGNIEIPKIGTLNVLNKTVTLLKKELKDSIKNWIKNPVIDIKVLNREITVLGELKNPGVVKVDKDQNNLLEILSKSGGTDFYANLKSIKVIRQDGVGVKMTNIDLTLQDNYLARNITLHPGDVVIVPSKKNKEFDKRVATIIPLFKHC